MTELIICGLGAEPPAETTLETLQALGACDVVYTDLADAKTRKWLAGYCKALKTGTAAQILSEKGRSVGVAVWGHPQFCGKLAGETARAAKAAGIATRVLGAVSPVGSAFARSVSFLGGDYGWQGLQGLELDLVLGDPTLVEPKLPLIVYSQTGGDWGGLEKALAGKYSGPARVFAKGKEKQVPLSKLKSVKGGAVVLVAPA